MTFLCCTIFTKFFSKSSTKLNLPTPNKKRFPSALLEESFRFHKSRINFERIVLIYLVFYFQSLTVILGPPIPHRSLKICNSSKEILIPSGFPSLRVAVTVFLL